MFCMTVLLTKSMNSNLNTFTWKVITFADNVYRQNISLHMLTTNIYLACGFNFFKCLTNGDKWLVFTKK